MKAFSFIVVFVISFGPCHSEEPCLFHLDCEDCLPENLPAVGSHVSHNDILVIPNGDEIHLHCYHTKFTNFPNKDNIEAFCVNGHFRITEDTVMIRHISELGCDADQFEDVLHYVDFCRSPFQGRSYQYRNISSPTFIHLAEVCYDAEIGRTIFAHMTLFNGNNIKKENHTDNQNKLSLLGNFNKMFDKSNKIEAEKVFDNIPSMNKKMSFLLSMHKFNFVDQILVPSKLLPSSLYYNQNGRTSKFVSNKVALWKSIADGNMKSLQNDIIDGFKRNDININNSIDIYVGTHDILSLQMGNEYHPIFLKPNKRYPVPKYIWTIVYNEYEHKAVAIIIINNPFISISEIRNTVFCHSSCNSVSWIKNLKLNNNYERSAYGLVFCCDIHSFVRIVNDSPNLISKVHAGEKGILKDGLPQ